jgi:hypothetical protein
MSLVDSRKAVLLDILVGWLILVSAVIVCFDACKNSRDTIPIRPATNRVLCPQIRKQSLIVDVAPRANGKDDHHVLLGI